MDRGLDIEPMWEADLVEGAIVVQSGTSEDVRTDFGGSTFDALLPSGNRIHDASGGLGDCLGLTLGSYHKLAAETASTGAPVEIFRAVSDRDRSDCMGLHVAGFTGAACNVDFSGVISLQAHESTYMGHRMVSGLVSPAVARVVVASLRGPQHPIPIHNGTFFYDGKFEDSIIAYDSDGKQLGAYDLE